MGSVGVGDSKCELQKEVRIELKDIGKKLLGLDFDNIDEQLNLLQRATEILYYIKQKPSDPIKGSLLPIAMALALDTDEFLRHESVKIQIAVASCMNELVRISAPESLYNDDHKMEVIFKLFMVGLNLLSDKSASNYDTPWRILETMAKVKTCLFMMDLNSGALITDMFHFFLNTIRLDHPREIYEYMLAIMTMVIQESDENEISVELLKPLLASVRKENKRNSPLSWELGNTVIETCATKLKPCLQEAVTSLNLVLDDFSEIVISLCHDTSNGETLTMQSGKGVSVDKSLLGALRSSKQIVLPNGDDLRPDMEHAASIVQSETQQAASIVQSETHKRYLQRRNSKEHTLRNESTEPSDSSRKKAVDGVSSSKDLDFKKKESLKQQQNDLEWSSAVRKKFRHVKMREPPSSSGCKPAKTNTKNLSRQKEKDKKPGMSSADYGNMLPKQNPGMSSADYGNMLPKQKPGMSSADYGEELLDLRIKVWWPMDETFYAGTVIAFDPIQKKHKIRYDDNEVENLNLKEETWELVTETWELVTDKPQETRPSLEEEKTEQLPPPEKPVKRQKTTVKRKPRCSKDKPAPSSSKRVKREINSEHDEICLLVVDTLKNAKLLPIKEEEHELSCGELGPIIHTESRQRVSTRSNKGYHPEQRCGRFFS